MPMRYPVRSVLRAALVSLSLCATLQAQTASVARILDSVSQDNLSAHIQELQRAGGHYSRVALTPGNDSAVAYIYNAFREIPGLTTVMLDTFYIAGATAPYNTRPQRNIVATLAGRSDATKQILLGAHMDCSASRNPGGTWQSQWATVRAPGADDNATGVAVILEVARLLGSSAFNILNAYTVTFVAFGAEESVPPYAGKISHPGSKHYAAAARTRGDQILAMMSIDMIGYNAQHDYTNIVSNAASQDIGATITAANSTYGIGLLTNDAPFASATFSDHAEFWANDYPAICLIENNAPWDSHTYYAASPVYHTSADSFSTLNMRLVRKVAQAVLGAVVALAHITVTSGGGSASDLPVAFSLDQNFPNPFNGYTVIQYHIPARGPAPTMERSRVHLNLYSVLGHKVATLVDEVKTPGTYAIPYEPEGLASGIYFYRLQVFPLESGNAGGTGDGSGEFTATRRLVLLR
ncbi:MAG: M20/M25/M40 family metallo-hydrolase [Bacteroidetes bacterium]|nr:M20/M25/M40 family metallo-hydrolase [Bacteroidota bacterium]